MEELRTQTTRDLWGGGRRRSANYAEYRLPVIWGVGKVNYAEYRLLVVACGGWGGRASQFRQLCRV